MTTIAITNGVEFFDIDDGEQDCQCARCGSSTSSEYIYPTIDGSFGGGVVYRCLSSEEWCDSHPMAGRESQDCAGH
jgi:hypothetical protein